MTGRARFQSGRRTEKKKKKETESSFWISGQTFFLIYFITSQLVEMPGGRPKGKKICDDCSIKKIKWYHTDSNLKRKSDEITAVEAKKIIGRNPKLLGRQRAKRRKIDLSHSNLNRYPDGKNQWSNSPANPQSPVNVLAFSVGKSDLGSTRLVKKMMFEK